MGLKAEIAALWGVISLVLALQGWAGDVSRYGPEIGSWVFIVRTTTTSLVLSTIAAYTRRWISENLRIRL